MLKKIVVTILSAASLFAMHNAQVNVNNKDLEAEVRFDAGQFNENIEPHTVFVGVKYINAEEKHSDARNIDDYQEVSFLMQRDVSSDFRLGLGGKLNHTKDFVSIPLGLEALYKLPVSSSMPFYVGGSLYYAPEVLSMDSAKDFLEFRATLDVQVIQNGYITVGYRHIDTNYKRGDVEYNESVYVGLKFDF